MRKTKEGTVRPREPLLYATTDALLLLCRIGGRAVRAAQLNLEIPPLRVLVRLTPEFPEFSPTRQPEEPESKGIRVLRVGANSFFREVSGGGKKDLCREGGHWLPDSLTGAVGSQKVTELYEGKLSAVGNGV